jgi:amidase
LAFISSWIQLTHIVAGYPIVTVPLGFFPNDTEIQSAGPSTVWPAPGVPFGLSFVGTAWSEFELIGFAYAYEQKTKTRLQQRAYTEAIPRTQLADVISTDKVIKQKKTPILRVLW